MDLLTLPGEIDIKITESRLLIAMANDGRIGGLLVFHYIKIIELRLLIAMAKYGRIGGWSGIHRIMMTDIYIELRSDCSIISE